MISSEECDDWTPRLLSREATAGGEGGERGGGGFELGDTVSAPAAVVIITLFFLQTAKSLSFRWL